MAKASFRRLAFFFEERSCVVESSTGFERVFWRMNSLIDRPEKVASVLIMRCCSGSISMVSLLMGWNLMGLGGLSILHRELELPGVRWRDENACWDIPIFLRMLE